MKLRHIDMLSWACAWLSAGLFLSTGIMLGYEVFARYLFTAPTIWAAELSELAMVWGIFLGGAWLLRSRAHIQITLLTNGLPARARRGLEMVVMLVIAAFSIAMVYYGWKIAANSFEVGRRSGTMLNLPAGIWQLAVPVGFTLLALQALAESLRLLRALRGGREARSSEGNGDT
jgi:C4-dicarboxylate transporter, DctQ subunit